MSIWQLRTAPADKFAPLAPTEAQAMAGTFEARGKPLQWKKRPKVGVFQEPKKKAALPRADVSLLMSGALVLNQNAHDALGPFLQEFGQFLELDVGGSTNTSTTSPTWSTASTPIAPKSARLASS